MLFFIVVFVLEKGFLDLFQEGLAKRRLSRRAALLAPGLCPQSRPGY
jgi:hypothetical protein